MRRGYRRGGSRKRPRTSAARSGGASGSMASARASAALASRRSWRSMPERHAALGEGAQDPAVERALDQRQQLGVRTRDGEDVGPRVVGGAQRRCRSRRRGRRGRRAPARGRARARRARPAGRALVAGQRGLARRRAWSPRRRARGATSAAQRRARRGELGTQRPRAVGAEQLVEPGIVRRGERADDDRGRGAELVSPRRNASPPARARPSRAAPRRRACARTSRCWPRPGG